ncbi:MAG TPA: tetratricopeptide repeat protein [Chloroflexia bacterium]|nr:tetratricopeptide repeat protein [Chloroflexia bacterium]
MDPLLAYLPQDRRAALAAGQDLPERGTGAALFADIAGFTALSEALTAALGPRRGIEALSDQINAVYEALIAAVDAYGGSVIGFAGDAITCWFDDTHGAAAPRAAACALAQQAALRAVTTLPQPAGPRAPALALKVAVAGGPARRFLVGDPALQVFEVLAGTLLDRLMAAEHLATPGEVVVDPACAQALGIPAPAAAWRTDPETGRHGIVVTALPAPPRPVDPAPSPAGPPLPAATARPWLHPAIYARLIGSPDAFLTELRPAVACFLRFGALDYDADPAAPQRLDAYIRWVQAVVARYDGLLLQLTLGDKGSYLYMVWGAPIAHDDDVRRAVAAAQELRTPPPALMGPGQIALSRGVMRTGASGSRTRRTYAVLGDEVNLTARLMIAATPGQVLASGRIYHATAAAFAWESLPAIAVKGKRDLVPVYALRPASAPDQVQLHEPRATGPLVGRTGEQAQILALLARARAGQGQVVGLVGEAGIGKSRLVAEIVRAAQMAGWQVYGGAAQSYGMNTPYLAWRGIGQAFFHLTPGDDPTTAAAQVGQQVAARAPGLVARVPLLGAVLGLRLPDTALTASLDEKLRKESREALLIDLLRGQAQQDPLLLVVEDAHWLDPLSQDLLDAVARAIPALPVLLLLAYRPPEIARRPAPRVPRLPYFTEVPLRELAPPEAAQLLGARLARLLPAETPVPAAAVAQLAARAQGNPFYLEELVNYLGEQGVDPTDEAALAGVDWPPSLHSLVLSRLDQLAERAQQTLKVASIVGRLFPVAWLVGYYPALGAAPAVQTALEETAQWELTVLDTPAPDLAYLFKHIVTQEVAYSSLAEATRHTLHGQFAAWLEADSAAAGAPPLDLLAYHYGRSANAAKRREYLRAAGDAAAATYSHAAAREYYTRLLEEPELPDAARGPVHQALGAVLSLMGAWAEALAHYAQAQAAAEARGDARGHAAALLAQGNIRQRQGAGADAIGWLQQARAVYAAAGDAPGESRALARLAGVYGTQGEFTQAQALAEASLEVARRVGDRRASAPALDILGFLALSQGQYAAARAWYETHLALQREEGDRAGIARALVGLAWLGWAAGDVAAARRFGDESLLLYRELGIRGGIAEALCVLGFSADGLGDYPAAQTLAAETLALSRELGFLRLEACALYTLAILAYRQHDYAAAGALWAAGLALAQRHGERRFCAIGLMGLGLLALAEGDPGGARARLRESLELYRPLGSGPGAIEALIGTVCCGEPGVASARLLGAIAQLREGRGLIIPPVWALYDQATAAAQAALGASAYRAAFTTGQALAWDAVVAAALDEVLS